MAKDLNKLRKIFARTDGNCHVCRKTLSFNNHGKHGTKGAWHIEHSKARSNGGSDHLKNLYPACISCNIEKATSHSRTARAKHGNTRAPYSKKKKEEIRKSNRTTGVAIGATVGTAIGGPVGGIVGGLIGGAFGNLTGPKK